MQQKSIRASRTKKATPPTVPPTIAPIDLDPELEFEPELLLSWPFPPLLDPPTPETDALGPLPLAVPLGCPWPEFEDPRDGLLLFIQP